MKLNIYRGKGLHIEMNNGLVLSVQIGGGNYCDNRDEPIGYHEKGYSLPKSSNAEIAIWYCDGDMMELPSGDTVAGYISIDRIFDAIPRLAALEDTRQPAVIAAFGEGFFD